MNLEQLCCESIQLLEKTGNFIRTESGTLNDSDLRFKGNRKNIVTRVDSEAENRLVKGLGSLLPEAGFLTEEHTKNDLTRPYTWVIDPLDGTTNFIYDLPVYAISVGLRRGNETILGMIHEINRSESFYAWENSKAYMNGNEIRVSDVTVLQDAILATGLPYNGCEWKDSYFECLKELVGKMRGMRRLGAAAIDLAYVACGRFDAYFEYGLNPWDVCAGTLIVARAGGQISSFAGDDQFESKKQMIASNPFIFDEFQQIINRHFQE